MLRWFMVLSASLVALMVTAMFVPYQSMGHSTGIGGWIYLIVFALFAWLFSRAA